MLAAFVKWRKFAEMQLGVSRIQEIEALSYAMFASRILLELATRAKEARQD